MGFNDPKMCPAANAEGMVGSHLKGAGELGAKEMKWLRNRWKGRDRDWE